MTPNLLRSSIIAALYSSALLPMAATAQDSSADKVKELERVEVTGSRIRQVNRETAQPVQIVTRADIEKTGLNNVFDVLNNLTASDGSGLSTVTTQTNGSNGDQQISLRGFGANRTLVLVDGKRWITDINGIVDVGSIPLAIIERIEVLKDGASAIYGSDAIGGVINIVTRKNYDGAQAKVYYGQTAKGDGGQSSADLTIGAAGEKTSGTFSISYKSQDSIFQGDREQSRFPQVGCGPVLADPTNASGLGAYCGSASGAFGRFTVGAGGLVAPGNYSLNHITPSATTGGDPLANGTITAADYHVFNNLDRYNFSPINYLQQPNELINIFTTGRFELTDNISVYGRVSYSKRTSSQQLAEVPTTIANSGSNGPQWIMNASASNIFNPFGVQINTINARNVAVGPRNNHFDFDILGAQLGAEGSFSIGDHLMNWEIYGQYNDGKYDQTGSNYINLSNLRNSLGQSGFDATPGRGFFCGASWATRVQGCVPFNIFGGPTLGLGANYGGHIITADDVAAMTDYVSYTLVQTSGNTSRQFGANLSGDLFELPGGTVSFALGTEFRNDDTFNQPDSLVSEGASSSNYQLATSGGTKVSEFYGEILLPLLKDTFLAKELELDIAVRKSAYKAAGLADPNPTDAIIAAVPVNIDQGSPTTWKSSLKWKPIDDLLVRASWGQTFRAPSSNNLFGGVTESFPAAFDPCRTANWANLNAAGQANCIAGGVPVGGATQPFGQIRSLIGSNVDLKPETGENFGLGFVYSPGWLEGLDLNLDLWRINLKNLIFTSGAGATLNNCYSTVFPSGQTGDSFFCQFVIRDPTAGSAVTLVNTAPINVASATTQGIDLGIGYKLQTRFGDFRFKFDTTWTDKFLFSTSVDPVTGQNVVLPDFVGTYGGAPTFEYRSTLTIGWSKGNFSANWTTRYLSDIAENTCFLQQASTSPGYVCNNRPGDDAAVGDGDGDGNVNDGPLDFLNHTGAYVVHDLQLSWKAPWDAQISIGGRNIFGKEPPVLYNTFAGGFDASYDLPGGAYWYASYKQDF